MKFRLFFAVLSLCLCLEAHGCWLNIIMMKVGGWKKKQDFTDEEVGCGGVMVIFWSFDWQRLRFDFLRLYMNCNCGLELNILILFIKGIWHRKENFILFISKILKKHIQRILTSYTRPNFISKITKNKQRNHIQKNHIYVDELYTKKRSPKLTTNSFTLKVKYILLPLYFPIFFFLNVCCIAYFMVKCFIKCKTCVSGIHGIYSVFYS